MAEFQIYANGIFGFILQHRNEFECLYVLHLIVYKIFVV